MGPHQPSVEDVLEVKVDLLKKIKLPLELIDPIIDFAEYWPCSVTIKKTPTLSVRAGGDHENCFIARSYPVGFLPEGTAYQITDEYRARLHTLAPQPWPEDQHIPSTATEEVLEAWTSLSQPRGEYPCRKIVFTTVSHDQGWGGEAASEDGYGGSYTWFDVGKEQLSVFREPHALDSWKLAPWPQFRILSNNGNPNESPGASSPSPLVASLRTISPRTIVKQEPELADEDSTIQYAFTHALIPSDECLQKNVVADRQSKEHKIVWKYDDAIDPASKEGEALGNLGRGIATGNGEYVRNLKIGDAVTVWGKARFPGWVNIVEEVKIEVYWAV